MHTSRFSSAFATFTLATDLAEGSTELPVDKPECFLQDDTIDIFAMPHDNALEHRYTIESTDPIKLKEAARHTYSSGTIVLRIHHPDNPTTCGAWPSHG